MAESTRPIDHVRERDIDLVLLSSLFASEPFRAFVLDMTIGWTKGHRLVCVRVSEADDSGETDVLLVVALEDGRHIAVMIEDKIAAIFQPGQAKRYRQRGDQGIRDDRWKEYVTCLCAPEGYLDAARVEKEWNAYISFEQITEWAARSDDRYHEFVGLICKEAVAKREARIKAMSREATAFWQAYRRLAGELLPNVDISKLPPLVTATSPWPRFGAATLPAHVLLEHKPQQGRVDLTFSKVSLDVLRGRIPPGLPFDIKSAKAGESAALRIAVPPVNHLRPFEEQQEEVLSALAAIERLWAIAQSMNTGGVTQPTETHVL